jgi:hypothetical protein
VTAPLPATAPRSTRPRRPGRRRLVLAIAAVLTIVAFASLRSVVGQSDQFATGARSYVSSNF